MKLHKVLIASEFDFGQLGLSFKRAFESLGVAVEAFDLRHKYLSLPLAKNRYLSYLFRWQYAKVMSHHLYKKVSDFKPELLLITKGQSISPEILRKIHSNGIKIFNFYPDNPFYYQNRSYGRSNTSDWIYQSFKIYDVFFIPARHLISDLYRHGCRRVEYLPFARDPELHSPYEGGGDLSDFQCDISFVGNLDKERFFWLNMLIDQDLKIWGVRNNFYNSCGPLKEKIQNQALHGEDFAKSVRASKISLNLMRQWNTKSHNMRTYEIPSCGGFALSPRNDEVTKLFREDVEAVYYSSTEEFLSKIRFYLNHPQEREKISMAAWKRVKNDTYVERVKYILNVYSETVCNDT